MSLAAKHGLSCRANEVPFSTAELAWAITNWPQVGPARPHIVRGECAAPTEPFSTAELA